MSIGRSKGKIPEEHAIVLQRNYTYLLEQVEACALKTHMHCMGILDNLEMSSITAQERGSPRKGMEELLNFVYYSGPDGFPTFIQCLRDSGYNAAAEKLDPTAINDPCQPEGTTSSIQVCLDITTSLDIYISLGCISDSRLFIFSPYSTIRNSKYVDFNFNSKDKPIRVHQHVIKCSAINVCVHYIPHKPCEPIEVGPTIVHMQVGDGIYFYSAICWDRPSNNEYVFYTSVDLSKCTSSNIKLFVDGDIVTSYKKKKCECPNTCYKVCIRIQNTLRTYKEWIKDLDIRRRNMVHFKPFKKLDSNDVHQDDEVFKFINQLGKRVVLVEYKDRESLQVLERCSGIVFRTTDTFYLQTNNMHHLVDRVNCYVTFNFDDDLSAKHVETVDMTRQFVDACFHQDKAIYTLQSIHKSIYNIPDISRIVVDIRITGYKVSTEGLVEYCKNSDKYVIHACVDNKTSFSNFSVEFSDGSSTNCTKLVKCHQNRCSRLHVDQDLVPSAIKKLFNKIFAWESTGHDEVVAIFHPHGDAKLISFGKSQGLCREHSHATDGVTLLNHTAATCPGSRGGCVLLLNDGNVKEKIDYNSRMCMIHGTTNGKTIGIIDGIEMAS